MEMGACLVAFTRWCIVPDSAYITYSKGALRLHTPDMILASITLHNPCQDELELPVLLRVSFKLAPLAHTEVTMCTDNRPQSTLL